MLETLGFSAAGDLEVRFVVRTGLTFFLQMESVKAETFVCRKCLEAGSTMPSARHVTPMTPMPLQCNQLWLRAHLATLNGQLLGRFRHIEKKRRRCQIIYVLQNIVETAWGIWMLLVEQGGGGSDEWFVDRE